MEAPFKNIFKDKTILVTGHTGFKGSWLSIWLKELGAKVIGYSLEPMTTPNHFELTGLRDKIVHIQGDVRDREGLNRTLSTYSPEIVFHLAAQAIVLNSYTLPRETFEINTMGTVNLLDAARENTSLKAMVLITTDKCYENNEWVWGYRENDRLGGKDPYSISKAMCELAIHSYRESFYRIKGPLVASARAGNVIGGGDFSDYRLMPDIMKALLQNKPVKVRNPNSVRPWLHVLDALCGYLQLAVKLWDKESSFAQAWNFGPLESQGLAVHQLVEKTIELWGKGTWRQEEDAGSEREMNCLRLNWDKAAQLLSWKPCYSGPEAIEETVKWFKGYELRLQKDPHKDLYGLCIEQIKRYTHFHQAVQ